MKKEKKEKKKSFNDRAYDKLKGKGKFKPSNLSTSPRQAKSIFEM